METSAVSVYDQGIIMWEIGHVGCVWPTKANRWVDHGAQQFFFYGYLQPHSLFTFQGMHNITVISLGEFNFLGKLNVICHLPSFGFQRELALWSWCASKYMLDHWCSLLTSVEFLTNKVLKHSSWSWCWQVISLGDIIKFSISPSTTKDSLTTNTFGVPLDEKNLVCSLHMIHTSQQHYRHTWGLTFL